MRKDLSRKLDRLSISYLESHNIDDILSRMINDTDVVRTGSAERFSTTVVVVYMIAGSLIMMPYTEWRLVVVTVIPTLAGFAVMFTVTRRFQK